MLISAAFSMAIYRVLTLELNRIELAQRFRVEHEFIERDRPAYPRPPYLDPILIEDTKDHIKSTLFLINAAILGSSALAGWFLAGRTLRPIKEMVEEQNRFITDASHELRTPLTALKTEIEVTLRDQSLTASDANKILKSNLEEVNKLQILADDLIKLTRSAKGGIPLSMAVIEVDAIIEAGIKQVSALARRKQIKLNYISQALRIEGNQAALTELIVILLDNAIKYSGDKTTVSIKTQSGDNQVKFEVIDQGTGIAPQDLPHIFDRFYRADKSRTKAEVDGYGLGLSIAKQIAEQHHGSIKAESQIEKGSTFMVTLPKKQPAGNKESLS
jgi:two-component system, OmpR family, sensor histidine kinase CiaH